MNGSCRSRIDDEDYYKGSERFEQYFYPARILKAPGALTGRDRRWATVAVHTVAETKSDLYDFTLCDAMPSFTDVGGQGFVASTIRPWHKGNT